MKELRKIYDGLRFVLRSQAPAFRIALVPCVLVRLAFRAILHPNKPKACGPLSARLTKTRLALIALSLAIGIGGGMAFYAAQLPLPWMLGPMAFVFAAVMLGAPLEAPMGLRPFVIPVIGVMLGSGFDADTFHNLNRWALSLAGLAVYLALAAALTVPFYIRIGKLDPITAFFAAMPGGINEMVVIGGAMGGDEKRIILAHAGRIVVSIAVIAVWFRVILGYEVAGVSLGGGDAPLTALNAVILILCAVLGAWLGGKLRLPAPGLLGPMILSALAHVTGLTHSAPPALLVIAAQVILGTVMGCRFRGAAPRLVFATLALTTGGTLIMLALSFVIALTCHTVFGQTVEQVLLAYAPGGLTEMSLVALAMQAEVAYISIHHLVRIVVLIALAPTVLPKIAKRF